MNRVNNDLLIMFIVATVLALMLTGCASTRQAVHFDPNMLDETIKEIHIMPVVDMRSDKSISLDKHDIHYFRKKAKERVEKRGYHVEMVNSWPISDEEIAKMSYEQINNLVPEDALAYLILSIAELNCKYGPVTAKCNIGAVAMFINKESKKLIWLDGARATAGGDTYMVTPLLGAVFAAAMTAPFVKSEARYYVIDNLFATFPEKIKSIEIAYGLHDAAKYGDINKLKAILTAKPDFVNAKDKDGATPLHFAVKKGRMDVIDILIADRADMNARNNDGLTPLHFGVEKGRMDVIDLLIANGADINAKNNVGITSLHFAVINGYRDIAEYLITNGADVTAANNDGVTPLHFAAMNGFSDIAELLITNGARVIVKTNSGFTPLYIATQSGHKETADVLRQHGGVE